MPAVHIHTHTQTNTISHTRCDAYASHGCEHAPENWIEATIRLTLSHVFDARTTTIAPVYSCISELCEWISSVQTVCLWCVYTCYLVCSVLARQYIERIYSIPYIWSCRFAFTHLLSNPSKFQIPNFELKTIHHLFGGNIKTNSENCVRVCWCLKNRVSIEERLHSSTVWGDFFFLLHFSPVIFAEDNSTLRPFIPFVSQNLATNYS